MRCKKFRGVVDYLVDLIYGAVQCSSFVGTMLAIVYNKI